MMRILFSILVMVTILGGISAMAERDEKDHSIAYKGILRNISNKFKQLRYVVLCITSLWHCFFVLLKSSGWSRSDLHTMGSN